MHRDNIDLSQKNAEYRGLALFLDVISIPANWLQTCHSFIDIDKHSLNGYFTLQVLLEWETMWAHCFLNQAGKVIYIGEVSTSPRQRPFIKAKINANGKALVIHRALKCALMPG